MFSKSGDPHSLPTKLSNPPDEWLGSFQKMGVECGLGLNMIDAFEKVDDFFQKARCDPILQ